MNKRKELFLILIVAVLSYGFMMEFQWPWMTKKNVAKTQEKKPVQINELQKETKPAVSTETKVPLKKSTSLSELLASSGKTSLPKPSVAQGQKAAEKKAGDKKTEEEKLIAQFSKVLDESPKKNEVAPVVILSKQVLEESKRAAEKKKSKKEDKKVKVKSFWGSKEKSDQSAEGQPSTAPTEAEIQKVQADLARISEQTKAIQIQSQTDRLKLQKILDQVKIQKRLVTTLKIPPATVPKSPVNADELLRSTKVRLIAEDVKKTQDTLKQIQQVQQISKVQKIPKKVSV